MTDFWGVEDRDRDRDGRITRADYIGPMHEEL